jgi:hypothetical protein
MTEQPADNGVIHDKLEHFGLPGFALGEDGRIRQRSLVEPLVRVKCVRPAASTGQGRLRAPFAPSGTPSWNKLEPGGDLAEHRTIGEAGAPRNRVRALLILRYTTAVSVSHDPNGRNPPSSSRGISPPATRLPGLERGGHRVDVTHKGLTQQRAVSHAGNG